jgi:hypothetical protein
VHAARRRRVRLVTLVLVSLAAVLAGLLLFGAARATTTRYHDDSLWANAIGSLAGTQRPGDFGYVFLPAANEILGGRSPYMDPDDFEGPPQAPYAYPPVLALALVPLTVPPETARGSFVPGVVFVLLLIAATVGGLALLDVRDWRCYPVALLCPFTLEAFEYGAVGPLLLLLIALLWRYRDRSPIAGSAAGVAVVLKLFLWPLLVWLAVTRRLTTAAVAAGLAVGLAFLSWAVIGFRGIGDYPALLRRLVDVEGENSYSTFAILRTLGAPELAAQILVIVAGVLLLIGAWRAAGAPWLDADEQDRRSLTLVLAAALVMTPILWLHYLVLLVVPIALARPRLSPLWFVLLAPTVFEALDWYRGWPAGDGKALASVAVVMAIVFAGSLRRPAPAGDKSRPVPAV